MNDLRRIASGEITLAFRRWKRPSVKSGGSLTTAVGVLAIEAVDPVDPKDIDDEQARRAGYDDRRALLDALDRHGSGAIHRITLHLAGADPRRALRAELPDTGAMEKLRARLQRMDRSASEPWTAPTLGLIAASEGVRAADLADRLGQPRDVFKRNVRKLKNLGLTESLETGYRLSPRGAAVLARLGGHGPARP